MADLCSRCHRPMHPRFPEAHRACEVGVTAFAVHASYDGYDCGHALVLLDAQGQEVDHAFTFDHPYGEPHDTFLTTIIAREWPWASIAWDQCHVIED